MAETYLKIQGPVALKLDFHDALMVFDSNLQAAPVAFRIGNSESEFECTGEQPQREKLCERLKALNAKLQEALQNREDGEKATVQKIIESLRQTQIPNTATLDHEFRALREQQRQLRSKEHERKFKQFRGFEEYIKNALTLGFTEQEILAKLNANFLPTPASLEVFMEFLAEWKLAQRAAEDAEILPNVRGHNGQIVPPLPLAY